MKLKPTEEEAQQATEYLSEAIAKFADEARHPRERGTPNLDPTWRARPSTLRFSYIRNGGWAWSMDAADPQVVAYYFNPQGKEPYCCVTAHGHARHYMHETLVKLHIYPTESPWREWYDFNERYRMEQSEPRRRY